MDYSGSENDSEIEDQINNLYTHLYFGENDTSTNQQYKSFNNEIDVRDSCVSESTDKPNVPKIEKLRSKVESVNTSKTKISLKLKTNTNKSKNTFITSEMCLQPNNKNTSKRKRNVSISSVTSIDSITGKEPLDNLYCLPEIIEISESEDSDICYLGTTNSHKSLVKKSSAQSLTTDSKCDLVMSFSKSKHYINNKSNSLSKNNNILYHNSVNHTANNTKKNRRLKANKKTKNKFREEDSSSDDEKIDEDHLDCDPNLSFNISKNFIWPTVVDYEGSDSEAVNDSKRESRLFRNCKSSCIFFSKEMSDFYDNDDGNKFSVPKLHSTQTDDPTYWQISQADLPSFHKRRYFVNREIRCHRCKETGHKQNNCTKLEHCIYCGSTDHSNHFKCPKKICLRCGEKDSHSCNKISPHLICQSCQWQGHKASLCPDTWRRYHNTTSGYIPVPPSNPNPGTKKRIYCCNCSAKGHYIFQCRRLNYNQHVVPTTIYSYDVPFEVPGDCNATMGESHCDEIIDESILSTSKLLNNSSSRKKLKKRERSSEDFGSQIGANRSKNETSDQHDWSNDLSSSKKMSNFNCTTNHKIDSDIICEDDLSKKLKKKLAQLDCPKSYCNLRKLRRKLFVGSKKCLKTLNMACKNLVQLETCISQNSGQSYWPIDFFSTFYTICKIVHFKLKLGQDGQKAEALMRKLKKLSHQTGDLNSAEREKIEKVLLEMGAPDLARKDEILNIAEKVLTRRKRKVPF